MAAFAPLVLKDPADVDVTFKPQSIDSEGVARWLTTTPLFEEASIITQQLNLPKNGSKVLRTKGRVMVPYVNTAPTGVKTVEMGYVNIEAVLPKTSSEEYRSEIMALAAGYIKSAPFGNATVKVENVY